MSKWGIDTLNPANAPASRQGVIHGLQPDELVPAGSNDYTFYDFVADSFRAHPTYGREPWFWGRYLNDDLRPAGRGPVPRSSLREGEADFIFARNDHVRILLVYNDRESTNAQRVATRGDAGYRLGVIAAEHALAIAARHVRPNQRPNVRIYADMEQWYGSAEWELGWMETMYQSEFRGAGGFYGYPVMPRPVHLQYPGGRGSAVWSRRIASAHRVFADRWTLPADLATIGSIEGTRAPAVHIWSSRPRGLDWNRMPVFHPERTVGGESVVWQYATGLPVGGSPTLGMDLALQQGWDDMWRAD